MAKRALKKLKKLDIEEFRYLNEFGLDFPQIVLGLKVPYEAFKEESYREYNFVPGRAWYKIAHETCGKSRKHQYLIGTILQPLSARVLWNTQMLADFWPAKAGGEITLNSLNLYRGELDKFFKADCNRTCRTLEEGFYPLDLEHITKLTGEILPVNLDDLILWDNGFERAMGCLDRWTLTILGKNSNQ